MTNKQFLLTYAISTWMYISASMLVPLAPIPALVCMGITFVLMIGSAMVRAKSAGHSAFRGLGVLVPVWQLFVIVELGK